MQKYLFAYRFRDLQNYTTLKRWEEAVQQLGCFRDLQNYTTLKLKLDGNQRNTSFRDLQNYTTLKPQIKFEAQE